MELLNKELAVSAHGYGDEGAFDYRAEMTGKTVIRPNTGKIFLRKLKDYSSVNSSIKNIKIFSHAYPRGIIMLNWSGFYYSKGKSDKEEAAYLSGLHKLIKINKINFSINSTISLFGCNVANGDFPRKLSDITNGYVVASYNGVEPEIISGRETGIFISATKWIKYYKGSIYNENMGKRYRAW